MRIALVALSLFSALFLSNSSRAAEPERPRLLVLVVFDQMRGDYLQKWHNLFGANGFARLQREGADFINCHYPYATTTTGPGHASILTGTTPDRHGIAQNEWYDRKLAKIINCSESARYQRVPALPKTLPKDELLEQPRKGDPEPVARREKLAGSPEYILAPTVGDALKEATNGKARVVGLSFKDRSALLPVGKQADAVYWLDSTDGMIVTSSYYRDSVHQWVAEFNKERVADRWFNKPWGKLHDDFDYTKYSGPDDVRGEGRGVYQGVTFPHPMHGNLKRPGKNYYDALFNSPFGNDFLFELVKKCLVAERLGKDETTDLLCVSFSSNDAVGHTWGPDSQEVLDTTLRSDAMMAAFLEFLDKEVGKGKYLLAITADHGICPLPEVTDPSRRYLRRLVPRDLYGGAEQHLCDKFCMGKPADPTGKQRWIELLSPPWVYLNQTLIERYGLKPAEVHEAFADYLVKQHGVSRCFTRADLARTFPDRDPVGQRVRLSYFPDRCGDVAVVLNPYCLSSSTTTGTNHGSPHNYDTHVPLLVHGPGVQAHQFRDAVTPQAIAAIFATAAGIKPPKLANYPVPIGLFD